MAQPCNAFLIDPHTLSITTVEWNGDYKHIYKLIEADCYDCARVSREGDGIFVDDEGLFKQDQRFFLHADYPNPLAGKGLMLGCDAEGESIAPSCTLDELVSKIRWVLPVQINGTIIWIDDKGEVLEVNA